MSPAGHHGVEVDDQLVDALGDGASTGIHPDRAPGAGWGTHQALAESWDPGRPAARARSAPGRPAGARGVEDEEGADRHRHAAAVDGELEHVVGAGPVDHDRSWLAHAPTVGPCPTFPAVGRRVSGGGQRVSA